MGTQKVKQKMADYADVGEWWRQEVAIDADGGEDVEELVDRLYADVEPLYRQLHAFVRGRLAQVYGPSLVDVRRHIPAHLLGRPRRPFFFLFHFFLLFTFRVPIPLFFKWMFSLATRNEQ